MSKDVKTLLLVDDEVEILKLLEELALSIGGVEVVQANNGLEALEVLKDREIDAIFSDIKMPKMDGIELLQTLRSEDRLTPFVILSAYGSQDNLIKALRLGALDFIDKPYSFPKVISVMKIALELGFEINKLYRMIEKAPDEESREKLVNIMRVKKSTIELKVRKNSRLGSL